MREPRQRLPFDLEIGLVQGSAPLLAHDLDGHIALQWLQLFGQPDHPHAALTERALEPERTDLKSLVPVADSRRQRRPTLAQSIETGERPRRRIGIWHGLGSLSQSPKECRS